MDSNDLMTSVTETKRARWLNDSMADNPSLLGSNRHSINFKPSPILALQVYLYNMSTASPLPFCSFSAGQITIPGPRRFSSPQTPAVHLKSKNLCFSSVPKSLLSWPQPSQQSWAYHHQPPLKTLQDCSPGPKFELYNILSPPKKIQIPALLLSSEFQCAKFYAWAVGQLDFKRPMGSTLSH